MEKRLEMARMNNATISHVLTIEKISRFFKREIEKHSIYEVDEEEIDELANRLALELLLG